MKELKDKELMRKRVSESQKRRWEKVTLEQKAEIMRKKSEAMRRYWQGMSMKERAIRLAQNARGKNPPRPPLKEAAAQTRSNTNTKGGGGK